MKTPFAFLGLSLLSLAASAQTPSYNYLDISYIDSEAEDVDGDGLGGELVAAFSDNGFFIGEYSTREFEDGGATVDIASLSLGIGVAGPIGDNEAVSGFAAATYEDFEVDVDIPGFGSGSDSENGFGLQIGLRAMIAEQVELHARYKRIEIDDEDESLLRFGAVFGLSPGLGLTLDYETYDESEIDELMVGVRLNFGL